MKVKVGFICVHNSCRSQMAEAIAKILAPDLFEAYSAGTEENSRLNQTAVRIMKRNYGIDISESQYPKTLDALPQLDIVITMGCNVDCPWLPSKFREDWGLDDPSGQPDQAYEETLAQIETKMHYLIRRIKSGELTQLSGSN